MTNDVWEYTEHDVGPYIVELRRQGGTIEFRPKYTENPTSYAAIEANAHLRAQGGEWVPVPRHLYEEAKGAFKAKR